MTDDDKPFHLSFEETRAFWLRVCPPRRHGPQLTLEGQCQIYAALIDGAWPAVVSKTFGVSRTTIGYIAGCRTDDRQRVTIEVDDGALKPKRETFGPERNLEHRRYFQRRQRYQAVADEFERLGYEAFHAKYYTPSLDARLKQARRELYPNKVFFEDR